MTAPDWVSDMRQSLSSGVRAVSAPSLFPTPPDVARLMVELANIEPHHQVLEPSAGTGRLIDAIQVGLVTAIEWDLELFEGLRLKYRRVAFLLGDFLELGTDRWRCDEGTDRTCPAKFNRIVMNPPFDKGADIKHIRHAQAMLAPGGRLVAICADGPRQREAFPGDHIPLKSGTFAGTGVRSMIILL